jgi:GNAT superfamily N-acetyltransferase
MPANHLEVVVRPISPRDTHELRRKVLRGGKEAAEVNFPGDDDSGAIHLGAFLGEDLIGVASLLPQALPGRNLSRAWRLRGMAVEPAFQRMGVGKALMKTAVEEARTMGIEVIWANARLTAVPFYVKLGMKVEGEVFLTPDTSLPHRRVWLVVER